MSITTTADEKLDSARDHIAEAAKDLSEIVVGNIYGSGEYRPEFKLKLLEAMSDLVKIAVSIR